MSSIDLVTLTAFRNELRKEGAGGIIASRLHSALGGAGALGGVGAAGGALVGAGVQGIRGYRAAREEGAGVGAALGSGASSALGGAQKGALIGGGAGLAAGGLGGSLAPGKMEGLRQTLTNAGAGVGSAARFGQRQVHAITGWKPGADASSIRSIGAGAHNAQEGLANAVGKANALHTAGESGPALQRAVKAVDSARQGYGAAVRSERMGLTSVPGYIRSMGTNGVLPTMSAGFKEQWHSMSPGWKALMIGAPAAEVVHAVKTPDEEGGPGKAERVAKGLAGAVAGATMGGIPMTTGNLLQHGLGRAAGAAGRVVDRYKKPVGELTADATHGQVVPSERYVTERAGGIHPEVTG